MTTNAHRLVTMANQIGDFFSTFQDRGQALEEIARHLRRAWEPRMRTALLAHLDQQGGAGLSDIVLDSLKTHRTEIL